MTRVISLALLLAGAVALAAEEGAEDERPSPEPSFPRTTAEDHAIMMEALGIESLRRGADGDPASPHAANTDEALANGRMGSLPPALVMDDGTPVDTPADWWDRRRPEVAAHFERELYGRVPEDLPPPEWTLLETESVAPGGRAAVRERFAGRLAMPGRPELTVDIDLAVTRPQGVDGAVPVVLALVMDPEFLARIRQRFTAEQWAAFTGGGPTWQAQVLARGWAAAELVATSVQGDSGAELARGVIGLSTLGEPRDPGDWGALRAWAWGLGRGIDLAEERPELDAARVAVHGHSRYGKAALVAMAFDERIAAGFISSSGEAGAKLWRRHFGEQVGNIAGSGEYHWMAGNFLRYAGPLDVEDLPVDQHLLIALAAPRPVFLSAGAQGDDWTDPRGMFLAGVHAGPVYRLLGGRPLESDIYPAVGEGVGGDIAWRQHEAGHTPGPNWPTFLDFAARAFARVDGDPDASP